MWKIHVEKACDKMDFYLGNFGGLENNPLDSKGKKKKKNFKLKIQERLKLLLWKLGCQIILARPLIVKMDAYCVSWGRNP